jgi:hypothetical protein
LVTKAKVKKNRKTIEVTRRAYLEINKIINVCLSARSLFEIYHDLAPIDSELIENRILYYKDRITEDLELLREVHNFLQNSDHSFTDAHQKLIYDGKGLTIWELGKEGTEEGKSGIDTSFSVGVSKYIARATDISAISEDVFRAHYENTKSAEISRLQYYILYNGENQLREIAEKSSSYYVDESMDTFDDNKTMLYVFSSLGSISVVLILIFFIPYIMKVEKNILSVFNHISNIPLNNAKKILDKCYTFKEDVELPFDKLQTVYNDEEFAATTNEQAKEEKKEEETTNKKSKKAKILSGLANKKKRAEDNEEKEEDSNSEDMDEDDLSAESLEKHYLLLVEKRRMETKKKMFTTFIDSKRRNYFLLLFSLLIFFVVFLVADVLLLNDFFKKGNETFYFISLFATRGYIYKTAMLFYRETLPISEGLSFTRITPKSYIR